MVANSTELGNNLVDYINTGGGVVTAYFSLRTGFGANGLDIQGSFADPMYQVIVPSDEDARNTATLGTVLLPSHPIMQNINSCGSSRCYSCPYSSKVYCIIGGCCTEVFPCNCNACSYRTTDRRKCSYNRYKYITI